MLWKVSGFLASAECLVTRFDSLEGDVFSIDTFQSIMFVLPPNLNQKIAEKEATTVILNGTFNTYRQTFKNIEEVLSKEAKLEAVASQYYDAFAENQRLYGQLLGDESLETIENSEQLYDKKTVHQND